MESKGREGRMGRGWNALEETGRRRMHNDGNPQLVFMKASFFTTARPGLKRQNARHCHPCFSSPYHTPSIVPSIPHGSTLGSWDPQLIVKETPPAHHNGLRGDQHPPHFRVLSISQTGVWVCGGQSPLPPMNVRNPDNHGKDSFGTVIAILQKRKGGPGIQSIPKKLLGTGGGRCKSAFRPPQPILCS